MAEICCGVASDSNTVVTCEPNSRIARRKRMDIRRFRFTSDEATITPPENGKRQKLEKSTVSSPRVCENAVESCVEDEIQDRKEVEDGGGSDITESSNGSTDGSSTETGSSDVSNSTVSTQVETIFSDSCPKFGVTSVCGRRRDMEDAVAIHPSFCEQGRLIPKKLHFFGVYDGHGCSHVAMTCKERLHELVKEEVANTEGTFDWKKVMDQSFSKMDQEAIGWCQSEGAPNCRCELRTPQCDAVGSTAVISIVTPEKIVVANCGDSRAVLSRGGRAIPLSTDHKPDRPDELDRIQAAGGRVIYWDGPRVLGVLAMSRAIGDNYLKPYVTSEPEVIIENRTEEDECIILASDGLWDVMSNETACGIVRMCLNGRVPNLPPSAPGTTESRTLDSLQGSDKVCSDAALLLTKLAMARNSTDNVSVVVVDLRRNT